VTPASPRVRAVPINIYDTGVNGPAAPAPASVVALGTAGAPAPGRLTTTFQLKGGVFIDTGAIVHAIAPQRRDEIKTVFLSHAHLDHTLGLPFLLGRAHLDVYGSAEVLDAVRQSLLDNRIWPDLSRFAEWHEFEQGDTVEVGGWTIVSGPSAHTVPCASFLCRSDQGTLAVVGDTRRTDEVMAWVAAARPDACIVECSFPDAWAESSRRWGHQTPCDLPAWRAALGNECVLCVTHIKPLHESTVRAECEALGDPRLLLLQDGDAVPLH